MQAASSSPLFGIWAYLTSPQFVPIAGAWGAVPVHTMEAYSQIPAPRAMTASLLTISLDAAPGSGNSLTFILRDNGSNTSLGCVIAGASAIACQDTTDTPSIANQDLLAIEVTTTGSGIGTSYFRTSFLLQ